MKKGLPIFFVHFSDHYTLDYAVNQVIKYNPDSEIIFIGDELNKRLEKLGITHVNAADYSQDADKMANMYVHLSPNSPRVELICLQRWLIVSEYVHKNNINTPFVLLDSDVLLYTDISRYIDKYFDGYDITLCGGFGPGYVTFRDKGVIKMLADTILKYYSDKSLTEKLRGLYALKKDLSGRLMVELGSLGKKDKDKQTLLLYEKYKKLGYDGNPGVSDMALIDLFVKENKIKVLDMTQILDGVCFDTHMGKFDERFPLKNGCKTFVMRNSAPYCHNVLTNEPVRFLSIHFQGYYKKYIFMYYTGPKNMVPSRTLGYINFYIQMLKVKIYALLVALKLKKVR